MRVLIGALVLGLCGWGSTQRLRDWRSDQALWTAAVTTTPRLPQAALRLSAAELQLGHWEEAERWAIRAAWESLARPDIPARGGLAWSQALRSHLAWLEAFRPVCGRPDLARWCA